MGRGQGRSAAIEARGLLYGQRRSKSKTGSHYLIPPPNSFADLDWPQYIAGLAWLTASLGLSQPPPVKQLMALRQANFEGTLAATIDIVEEGGAATPLTKSSGGHLRLIPAIGATGSNVGIYYINNDNPALLNLMHGRHQIHSSAEAEGLLVDELRQRQVKSIGLTLDGRELLSRWDQHRPIKMTAAGHPLSNQDNQSWTVKLNLARHYLSQSHSSHSINHEEQKWLNHLLDNLNENSDILTAFASDPVGRKVIGGQNNIYVVEQIN